MDLTRCGMRESLCIEYLGLGFVQWQVLVYAVKNDSEISGSHGREY
jgi:hypothetical protein